MLPERLADDWALTLRGDIGGFAIESDFSWSSAIGVLYQVSESVAVEVQYKAQSVDYDEGRRRTPGFFSYDTISHGPLLGLSFVF